MGATWKGGGRRLSITRMESGWKSCMLKQNGNVRKAEKRELDHGAALDQLWLDQPPLLEQTRVVIRREAGRSMTLHCDVGSGGDAAVYQESSLFRKPTGLLRRTPFAWNAFQEPGLFHLWSIWMFFPVSSEKHFSIWMLSWHGRAPSTGGQARLPPITPGFRVLFLRLADTSCDLEPPGLLSKPKPSHQILQKRLGRPRLLSSPHDERDFCPY